MHRALGLSQRHGLRARTGDVGKAGGQRQLVGGALGAFAISRNLGQLDTKLHREFRLIAKGRLCGGHTVLGRYVGPSHVGYHLCHSRCGPFSTWTEQPLGDFRSERNSQRDKRQHQGAPMVSD